LTEGFPCDVVPILLPQPRKATDTAAGMDTKEKVKANA
jgi:hypothetical protein